METKRAKQLISKSPIGHVEGGEHNVYESLPPGRRPILVSHKAGQVVWRRAHGRRQLDLPHVLIEFLFCHVADVFRNGRAFLLSVGDEQEGQDREERFQSHRARSVGGNLLRICCHFIYCLFFPSNVTYIYLAFTVSSNFTLILSSFSFQSGSNHKQNITLSSIFFFLSSRQLFLLVISSFPSP